MWPNAILLLTMLAATVGTFLLAAYFLRLGLRLARAPYFTRKEVFLATALCWAWNIFFVLTFDYFFAQPKEPLLLEELFKFVIAIVGSLFIIRLIFPVGVFGSFVAWLPTNLSGILVFAFVLLVCRPFLFEAFIAPTDSMAPTIVGPNYQSKCPICDSTCRTMAYSFEGWNPNVSQAQEMICENFHVTSHVPQGRVFEGDRFLAAKFVSPRRWDLVVFQSPEHPEETLVKRLVGLPGESIYVEKGQLFVDGSRLEYPSHLANLRYEEIPDTRFRPHATTDNPAQLGDDEYLVLGDFSVRSLDSRYWKTGQSGYSPFAVPRSNIIGVAVNIFWPWARMRVLRH